MPELANSPLYCVKCRRPGRAYETWTGKKHRYFQIKYAHHLKVDGKWIVRWCYIPKRFFPNSKNELNEKRRRKRKNLEQMVNSLLEAGGRGVRIWDIEPRGVSRRTSIRYVNELRKKKVVARFVDEKLPAPVYAYRLTQWARSCAEMKGPRYVFGSKARRYMELYYETLMLKLIWEKKGQMYIAELRSVVCQWMDSEDPVQILSERQFYASLFELLKNDLVFLQDMPETFLQSIRSWTPLRFLISMRERPWLLPSLKVFSLIGSPFEPGRSFPFYYRVGGNGIHPWVEWLVE
jgi:hypothetical protein